MSAQTSASGASCFRVRSAPTVESLRLSQVPERRSSEREPGSKPWRECPSGASSLGRVAERARSIQRVRVRHIGWRADGVPGDTDVDIVSLDEYVESHGINVDALKIDVEGYEPKAIAGMRKVLDLCPTFLTEFSLPHSQLAGTNWAKTLDQLFASYTWCLVSSSTVE